VVALLASVAFGVARVERDSRARLRAALLVLVPCGALVLPWVVRNLVTTGNPVFPNLYGLFGGPYWSETQVYHHWKSLNINGGEPKDLASYVLLPWRLVVDAKSFIAATFSGGLMAVFLAGLVQPRSYRGVGLHLQGMALGGLVAWAATIQSGRYLVALVPLVALASLVWLAGRRQLVAVAVLVLGVAAAQRVARPVADYKGTDVFFFSREELLARDGGWLLCRYLNRALPPEAKVLGAWYNRFFFLERPFEADPLYEAPSALARLRELDDPEAFAREPAARGFTHVVVGIHPQQAYLGNTMRFDLLDDRFYPRRRLRRDRALYRAFEAGFLEPLPWAGPGAVYRLRIP
jgi:hypothetical protein